MANSLAYLMSEYQRKNAELAEQNTGEGAASQESPFGEINGQMFDLRTGESLGTTNEWNAIKANKSDWSSGPLGSFGLDPIGGWGADFLQGGGGPYVGMALVGGAAAAGAGGAGAGAAEGLAAGGGAALSEAELATLASGAGLGNTAPAASGFMTPAGAGLGAETAGFAGSVGSPVATGAGALPGWAEGAGAAGAAGAAGTGMSGGGGSGGGGTAAPAGSALSRIIDGTASNADWLSVLGTAGATGLGMYSANQQSNSLERLAEQTRAERAPFLNQATGWLNNPDSYWQGPGQASLDANLRKLSASHGNPISSPTALGIASQAGMQDWRNAWSTAGNLGLGGQDIRAQLGTGAAGADANVWSTLAGGVGDIVNPRKSLSDMMREYATVIGGMRT